MSTATRNNPYLRGIADGLPFILVIIPFALLFGVVGTEAGLDLAQVMGMTVLVIAGAAQFAALQQMVADSPVVIVVITALAVNLRMAMYSASLVPHLGRAKLWQKALVAYMLVDQSYALGFSKYESEPELPLGAKLAYFFGTMTPIAPLWYLATWIGAVAGSQIPPQFALDFAMPITFIAMVAPMLKSLAHVAAAVTSIAVALVLAWLPYGLGLLIAAVLAMLVGAGVEILLDRRRNA